MRSTPLQLTRCWTLRETDAADRDALLAAKNAEGRTVEEMVTEKSGQTGEKIELAYYARIEAPYCHAYVHFNKKLGTLIGFNKVVPEEVAHTVAMQATAMAPVSISEADCPADVIEHERKIAVEAMKQDPKNANKPELFWRRSPRVRCASSSRRIRCSTSRW